MLQTNTVDKHTLELLNRICKNSVFNDFYLVGGTALALQLGHRKSIDLDFFSEKPFESEVLLKVLVDEFKAIITSVATNAITGRMEGVKFDFISHQYPALDKLLCIDSIRLSSLKDIAAMKFNAIRNRGTKKDFIDIYFLLNHFTLSEMMTLTNKKYPNHIDILTLKSLVYFEDAELDPDCDMVINTSWEDVKDRIKKEVLPFL